MFSKLNCYKFQTISVDYKDTKLQKYLRERNEKILQKCFNIKVECNARPKKELQETRSEKAGQQSIRESCQQTCKNISGITDIKMEHDAQQTRPKTETESGTSLKSEKTMKSKAAVNNMPPIKSLLLLECSSIKRHTFRQSSSHCNRSINSNSQSKPLASSKNWKSPFTSFTTKGMRARSRRDQQSSEFSYDLSRDELKFAGHFQSPMKPTPEIERQLLNSGKRKEYLMHRYEHSPVVKYYYPEATSWRIGWLLQKQ